MIPASRRSRARWIAVLCAAGAIPVAAVGIGEGVRHVRESQAIEALRSPETSEREAALRQLEELRSVRAVPGILESMAIEGKYGAAFHSIWSSTRDAENRKWEGRCARVIRETGTAAVPLLRSRLGSANSAERFWSLFFLLWGFEIVHGDSDPAVFSFLDDPDEDVRTIAAIAVGIWAAKDHRLLQRLVTDLRRTGPSEGLRAATAIALEEAADPDETWLRGFRSGAAALETGAHSPEMTALMRSAATALLESAEDSAESVLSASLDALLAIRERWLPEDTDLKSDIGWIIRRGIAHENASRRLAAAWRLDRAFQDADGSLPRDVLEILGSMLEDIDPNVRKLAERYLAIPSAIPLLLEIIERGEAATAPSAREILDSMADLETWTIIFEHLARPDGSIRTAAVDLLSSMGAVEGMGIDRLSRALASKDPGLRRAAAQVLERYHASRSVEAHAIFPLLFHEDEDVRSRIAAALSLSGNLPADWRKLAEDEP